jgi:hypothetical protein
MANVLFTISYDILPEKREEYLALANAMKAHLVGTKGKNYSIYELKNKKNSFSEIFFCKSREEYDQLEDDQDEKTEELASKLEALVDGKTKYSTLIELDEL